MAEERKDLNQSVDIEKQAPAEQRAGEHGVPEGGKKKKRGAFSYLFEEGEVDPYDAAYEQWTQELPAAEAEERAHRLEEGFGSPEPGAAAGYQTADQEEKLSFTSSFPAQRLPRDLSLFEEDEQPPKARKSWFSRFRRPKKAEEDETETQELFDPYHSGAPGPAGPESEAPKVIPRPDEPAEAPGDPSIAEGEWEEEELDFFHYLANQAPAEETPVAEVTVDEKETEQKAGPDSPPAQPETKPDTAVEGPDLAPPLEDFIKTPAVEFPAEEEPGAAATAQDTVPEPEEEAADIAAPADSAGPENPAEGEPGAAATAQDAAPELEEEEAVDIAALADSAGPENPAEEELGAAATAEDTAPEPEEEAVDIAASAYTPRRVEGAFLVSDGEEPRLIYTPPGYKTPLDAALGGGVAESLRPEFEWYRRPAPQPEAHPSHPVGVKRKKPEIQPETAALENGEVPEEYRRPEDAASVRSSISHLIKRLFYQCAATAALTLFLFALALLNRFAGPLPGPFSAAGNAVGYLTVNLAALGVAMLVCAPTVFGGIKSLFTLRGDADTASAFGCAACLVQILCGYGASAAYGRGEFVLFAPVAVGTLFLNTLGKFLIMKRTQKNFRFVSSTERQYAVKTLADGEADKRLVTDTTPSPVVGYGVKTDFLRHFLRISYAYDQGETASQKISLYTSAGALVLGIIAFLVSKNICAALAAFASAACIAVPAANMLVANVPLYRSVKKLLSKGVMLAGAGALEEFGEINYLMLDADSLFPQNAVVLNVIKTFSQLRVDEAIVDAAALVCAMGGPMADMFNRIIQGRANILPKVDSFAFEEGMGAIGWVSGRRILVGNRDLMQRHGIQPPSKDYEQKYTQGGRCITYLAAGGDLVAMFVMSYTMDPETGAALGALCKDGVKLLVRARDVNVTAEMVEQGFGLPAGMVELLDGQMAQLYEEKTQRADSGAEAYLGFLGRAASLCRGVSACIRLKTSISLAVLLQTIGVVLGLGLVLVLALSSGIAQLGVLELACFSVFWIAVSLLIPALRRS